MKRVIQPEMLDALPAEDPRARRSRRDLCRVNAWMGNHGLVRRALQGHKLVPAPGHLTELGAGDGQFLLRVARELPPLGRGFHATLLDQCDTLAAETQAAFAKIGWRARPLIQDVRTWIEAGDGPVDIVVANLFLHHFHEPELLRLLAAIATRARFCVAVEPRRAFWPLVYSRLLGLIGCGPVTRHDAAISVRAGFANAELATLWPKSPAWELTERSAGPFSHLFVARRSG